MPGHGGPAERWARITAESVRPVRAGGTVLAELSGHHVMMADPGGQRVLRRGEDPVT